MQSSCVFHDACFDVCIVHKNSEQILHSCLSVIHNPKGVSMLETGKTWRWIIFWLTTAPFGGVVSRR